MPTHDWRQVESGIFHAFHTRWISELQGALNEGLLPPGYYALAEQHLRGAIADILTLNAGSPRSVTPPEHEVDGSVAVAEVPLKTGIQLTARPRRSLAIRHVSGHQLIAVIEIVSPGNIQSPGSVAAFTSKAVRLIDNGVHLSLIDLFGPTTAAPNGLHGEIWSAFDEEWINQKEFQPVTVAAYCACEPVEAWIESRAIHAELPAMPLFLRPDQQISIPLEATYLSAWRGMPQYWRDVLESV